MRIHPKAAALAVALALSPVGCGDDSREPVDWKQPCNATCQRFKDCIPNLKDSPSQIWVCRCEENEQTWSTKGDCIETCARRSSCDDLWNYFRNSLTNSPNLYMTDFYGCQSSCE
jgi:hypothetical protein